MKLVVVRVAPVNTALVRLALLSLSLERLRLANWALARYAPGPTRYPPKPGEPVTNAHAFGNDAGLPTIPPELTLLRVAPVKMAPFRPAS